MSLSNKRLFLLDMDGTIYLSDTLFDGTIDFLNYIKRIGGRYLFLTNNSSRGTDAYIDRMQKFGIQAKPEDFLTSTDATIRYLHAHYDDACYYVCGTQSLKNQLRQANLRVAQSIDDDIDVVLLGYDTELTYQKLVDCCILLGRGLDYIATHPDPVCPTWYGSAPDCGSVIEMLFTATGRRPETIIGKPKPEMALMAMELYGYSKEQTCMIGDRLYTDIACGVNAGIDTVFVLSGEGVMQDIEKYQIQPTYIYQNIREILNSITEENSL